jgi:hypothetical protein
MWLFSRVAKIFKPVRRKPTRCAEPRCARLVVEVLEDRVLLAWAPIGPAPLLNSTYDSAGVATEAVTGHITALEFGQDNGGTPALFLGSASGRVWRSTNFAAAQPTWTPLTIHLQPGGHLHRERLSLRDAGQLPTHRHGRLL